MGTQKEQKGKHYGPLKPCPFCGGKPFLRERTDDDRATLAIVCNDCTAQGPWTKTREAAIERWNLRQ